MLSNIVAAVTLLINMVVSKPINAVVKRLHLPATVAQIATHIVLVFTMAFSAQVSTTAVIHVNWPTVFALFASAAAAGGSAVVHYLVGLVPTPEAKAAARK